MPYFEGISYPNEYECSIRLALMNDPVVAADGFSYERNAIEEWIGRSQLSPKTGLMLANTNLIPNENLRILIQDFRNQVAQAHIEEERRQAEVERARLMAETRAREQQAVAGSAAQRAADLGGSAEYSSRGQHGLLFSQPQQPVIAPASIQQFPRTPLTVQQQQRAEAIAAQWISERQAEARVAQAPAAQQAPPSQSVVAGSAIIPQAESARRTAAVAARRADNLRKAAEYVRRL